LFITVLLPGSSRAAKDAGPGLPHEKDGAVIYTPEIPWKGQFVARGGKLPPSEMAKAAIEI
jgi:hypothetical protein